MNQFLLGNGALLLTSLFGEVLSLLRSREWI